MTAASNQTGRREQELHLASTTGQTLGEQVRTRDWNLDEHETFREYVDGLLDQARQAADEFAARHRIELQSDRDARLLGVEVSEESRSP